MIHIQYPNKAAEVPMKQEHDAIPGQEVARMVPHGASGDGVEAEAA